LEEKTNHVKVIVEKQEREREILPFETLKMANLITGLIFI
jgi:hypothetical protein